MNFLLIANLDLKIIHLERASYRVLLSHIIPRNWAVKVLNSKKLRIRLKKKVHLRQNDLEVFFVLETLTTLLDLFVNDTTSAIHIFQEDIQRIAFVTSPIVFRARVNQTQIV
jgi:hypothetical protein